MKIQREEVWFRSADFAEVEVIKTPLVIIMVIHILQYWNKNCVHVFTMKIVLIYSEKWENVMLLIKTRKKKLNEDTKRASAK